MSKFNSMPRVEGRFDPEGSGYDYSTAMSSGGASSVQEPTDSGSKVKDLAYSKTVPASKDDIKNHGLPNNAELVLLGVKNKGFKDLVGSTRENGDNIVKKGGRYFIVPPMKATRTPYED